MSAAPAAKRARAPALDATVSTLAVPGLGAPTSLFVQADGNCLVSTEEHTLLMLAPSGQLAVIAGSEDMDGFEDGKGAAARFNFPGSFTVDPAGCMVLTRRLPSACTNRLLGVPSPGTASVDTAASSAGARARLAAGAALIPAAGFWRLSPACSCVLQLCRALAATRRLPLPLFRWVPTAKPPVCFWRCAGVPPREAGRNPCRCWLSVPGASRRSDSRA